MQWLDGYTDRHTNEQMKLWEIAAGPMRRMARFDERGLRTEEKEV